jgi:phage gp45-like
MNFIRKIKNLIKTGTLNSVDNSGNYTFYNVSFLGKTQKLGGFVPYGLISNCTTPGLVLLLSQLGQESSIIGIADDPKNRKIKPVEGESGLENYLTEAFILLKENGDIEVNSPDSNVIVNAPNGNTQVNCIDVDINATGDIIGDCVNLDINATGNITADCVDATLTATGDVTATVTGDIEATCANAKVTATTKAEIIAPTINLTGNVIISGTLNAGATTVSTLTTGGLSFAGTPNVSFPGDITLTTGDVILSSGIIQGGFNGADSDNHIHSQGNDSDGSIEVDTGVAHI